MLAQSVWHYPSTYLRLILLGVIRGVNSVPAHTDQEPVRLIDWAFTGPTDTQYSLNKHYQKHQKDPLKYQLLGLNCRRAYLHFMTTDSFNTVLLNIILKKGGASMLLHIYKQTMYCVVRKIHVSILSKLFKDLLYNLQLRTYNLSSFRGFSRWKVVVWVSLPRGLSSLSLSIHGEFLIQTSTTCLDCQALKDGNKSVLLT